MGVINWVLTKGNAFSSSRLAAVKRGQSPIGLEKDFCETGGNLKREVPPWQRI